MVSEPTTTIHGGLERHIKYGSLINLTCEIQSYPGQLQYVVWYRNHQSLMKNPRYDIRYILTDMHGPNGQNVTIWRVIRCFCGYLTNIFEKIPKSPIFWQKMYKSGNSGWNWISVIPDRRVTRHEHFWSNIGDFWLFLKKFGGHCAIFVW